MGARGLTLYVNWAGHRVSDLDMAVMALNVSIRFCPVPPTGKATPQKPSMFALQDEPTTPANARNHARGFDAASVDASRLPLPRSNT